MRRSATLDTILAHRSVRAFTDDPLPEGAEEALREAMRRGPTSSALQTYTFVLVHDRAVRARIRPYAGDQAYVEQCAMLVVACADLRRVQAAATERAYPYRAPDLRILISAVEDMTIAVQNASLAAQSLGLGTVMIGGVANGMREIHDLLGLPPRVAPLLGLCVGTPAPSQRELPARPRLPAEVVFHRDRFDLDREREAALLAEHDREVIARGFYQDRRIGWDALGQDGHDPVPEDAYGWTEHVARKQARTWWDRFGPKFAQDLATLGIRIEPAPSDATSAPDGAGEPDPARTADPDPSPDDPHARPSSSERSSS